MKNTDCVVSPRLHRGWWVCLGCALALFTVMGLGVNVFSVYQPYLLEGLRLTNAQGSWITTVRSLFSLLSMATVDRLARRLGLRRTMTLGMACFVLSYLLFGAAGSFLGCAAGAALTGLAYGYGGMIPLALVISRWFRSRRGFALGLAAAGSGVSTILMPPLLTLAIQSLGLSAAFLLEAALGAALTLAVFLLVRSSPRDVGLTPYETGSPIQADPQASAQTQAQARRPAGLSRPIWWAVVFAAFLTGAPGGPGFSHLTVLYTAEGFSSGTVALLVSYLGVVLIAAKILSGWLSDALGSRVSNCCVLGSFLAGFLLCCLAPTGSLALAVAAITFTALGMPLSSVSLSLWADDLSGPGDYDRNLKWLTSAYMLGCLVTGPLPGSLADRFGSYVPTYGLFSLFLLLTLVIIQAVYLRLGIGGRKKSGVK